MNKADTKEVIKLNAALLNGLITKSQYYEFIGNMARSARTKKDFAEFNAILTQLKGN